MRIVQHQVGEGAEKLQLIEQPKPLSLGPSQVLIEVAAFGINRPDLMQRKGLYPPPRQASSVLGLEVSGVIRQCGVDVGKRQVGEHICALVAGGGYAEWVVAEAVCCLPIPDGFSWESAAALPENYFTVWENVFRCARLQSGEIFLVHRGSSGIGLAAIGLAKCLGAQVLTTVSTEVKAQACYDRGADGVLIYPQVKDFVEEIRKNYAAKGVDVILDMVGGPYFSKNIALLTYDGRLRQIAFMAGSEAFVDLLPIMSRRLSIGGSTLRRLALAQKALIASDLYQVVWPLLSEGSLLPVPLQVFSANSVVEAHRALENRQRYGKIVVTW